MFTEFSELILWNPKSFHCFLVDLDSEAGTVWNVLVSIDYLNRFCEEVMGIEIDATD